MSITQEFCNQEEAAKILGRTTRTIRNMEKRGEIRRSPDGKPLYYIADIRAAFRAAANDSSVQVGESA